MCFSNLPEFPCSGMLVFLRNFNLNIAFQFSRNIGKSVGIATSYELDDRGIGARALVGSKIFLSPYRPDRLQDPPNFLSNGYDGFFTGNIAGRSCS
jgi:hypothetical protein